MPFDYSTMQAKATDLIARYGRSVTLVSPSTELLDEAAPWKGVVSEPTSASATAVFIDYDLSEIDNDLIRAGDMRCLITGANSSAGSAKTLTDGNAVWNIVKVNQIKPGGTSMLFELQLRK